MSANELMEFCKEKNSVDSISCDFFMLGFAEGMFMGSSLDVSSQVTLSSRTLRNMFMKRMREYPEYGDSAAQIELGYVLIASGKAKLRKQEIK